LHYPCNQRWARQFGPLPDHVGYGRMIASGTVAVRDSGTGS
jgi:hypothetical protein